MALCLAATGCVGADSGQRRPAEEETPRENDFRGLNVTLVQYRSAEGSRSIDVQVTNTRSVAIRVTAVRLYWPGFTDQPATPKDTTFAVGQTIDLDTTYGTARCDADLGAAPFVVLTIDGAGAQRVELDGHGTALLRRLQAHECYLERVAEVASIELGPSFRTVFVRTREYLAGSLLVTRPPSSADGRHVALGVTGLSGSVLVDFSAAGVKLPVILRPAGDTLRIPVVIGSSGRCDAHARAESKQTFSFGVFVRLPGEPVQRVIVSPDRSTQARSLALIDRACG